MLSAADCDHISKVSCTTDYYFKVTHYCNHSVIVIRYGLAQNDHIKWHLCTVLLK
jgi:hypothetical protein